VTSAVDPGHSWTLTGVSGQLLVGGDVSIDEIGRRARSGEIVDLTWEQLCAVMNGFFEIEECEVVGIS
jgi:hypothetical protein